MRIYARNKKYLFPLIGIILFLTSVFVSCAGAQKIPYAPDFTLKSLKDETVRLSDFLGKPVMLTFWKIDCPACELQMPFMQSLYNELSGQDITVLTVNAGDNPVRVQDFAASHELNYPILIDQQIRVCQEYGIPGVPMTFFIDEKGIIKTYKIGAFESKEALEDALKNVFPSLVFPANPEVGPDIGKLAPDFTLQTSDNQSVTLSDFRGKAVLLNFWVSSCPACVDEMPYFQKVLDKQTNEKLAVLSIDCGETSQTLINAADKLGLTFPMLLDPDGKICAAYKHGCPTTFLISERGIIKAIRDDVFQGPDEIETMLNML